MSTLPSYPASEHNPIDSVERVLTGHNWVFERMSDHELVVQVQGKACEYSLFFIWQEHIRALQFCAQYSDIQISDDHMNVAARAVLSLNENMWVGHFDLPADSKTPSFRHTCLLGGVDDSAHAMHIEDMMDLALAQCERHFHVFHMLSLEEGADEDAMALALMNAAGEA